MRERLISLRSRLNTHRERPRLGVAQWQAIAATLQSVSLTAAVIVGGVWTWYTFRAQRQADTAQAQLLILKRQFEREPRLEININTVQLKVPGSEDHHVVGSIHVKNVGDANTVLQLESEPVRIYQVTVGPEGEVWSRVRSPKLMTAPTVSTSGLLCQVGATKEADFITMIDAAGLYVVTFSAARNAAEATAAKSLGAVPKGPEGRIEWQAQHYFVIN